MGKRTTLHVNGVVAAAKEVAAPVAKAKPRDRSDGDLSVGKRLRIRRVQIGMSQNELANRLGVSFQQIQKYEKGTNRVSAGRLEALAAALQVEFSYFFGGDRHLLEADGLMSTDTHYNLRLLRAYNAIVDTTTRRRLVALMECIAGIVA